MQPVILGSRRKYPHKEQGWLIEDQENGSSVKRQMNICKIPDYSDTHENCKNTINQSDVMDTEIHVWINIFKIQMNWTEICSEYLLFYKVYI